MILKQNMGTEKSSHFFWWLKKKAYLRETNTETHRYTNDLQTTTTNGNE